MIKMVFILSKLVLVMYLYYAVAARAHAVLAILMAQPTKMKY